MVGVQDEQHLQASCDRLVELIGFGGESEAHPDEVLDVAQGVVRIQGRLSHGVLVGKCCQGGDLGQQAQGCLVQAVQIFFGSAAGEGGKSHDPG